MKWKHSSKKKRLIEIKTKIPPVLYLSCVTIPACLDCDQLVHDCVPPPQVSSLSSCSSFTLGEDSLRGADH